MPDISLITIVYKNSPEVLRACFESIAKSQGVTYEVIIIDNAGDAQTLTRVSEVLPHATVIINAQNKGFASATNQGLQHATGRYALMLNPDTSFAPNVLASMVAHMDAAPEVGIGSCLLRYPDGTLQESIRRFPTLSDQLPILFKLPHVMKSVPAIERYMMHDVDPYQTQDVESIMGAFMMIRRGLERSPGEAPSQEFLRFDERYFLWFEEVDYCKMVHDAGWKIRHFADLTVTHHRGASFSRVGFLRKQVWFRQSMRKYMKKHHGLGVWAVLTALAPFATVLAYLGAWHAERTQKTSGV